MRRRRWSGRGASPSGFRMHLVRGAPRCRRRRPGSGRRLRGDAAQAFAAETRLWFFSGFVQERCACAITPLVSIVDALLQPRRTSCARRSRASARLPSARRSSSWTTAAPTRRPRCWRRSTRRRVPVRAAAERRTGGGAEPRASRRAVADSSSSSTPTTGSRPAPSTSAPRALEEASRVRLRLRPLPDDGPRRHAAASRPNSRGSVRRSLSRAAPPQLHLDAGDGDVPARGRSSGIGGFNPA